MENNKTDWNVSTLKEHLEKLVEERDKANKLFTNNLDKRLDEMNDDVDELRKNESNFSTNFFSRESHQAFADQMNKDLTVIREDIQNASKPQWNLLVPAATLLLSIVGTLWYLAVGPINAEIQHQKDTDSALEEQVKLTNSRIDRLYDLYRDLQAQHFQKFGAPPVSPLKDNGNGKK